jgi:ATP-dependent Clp protease, protease subunit
MILAVNQNTITAYGTIWDGNGMEFVNTLSRLESTYDDIFIKIHSYGGSVFDGNLIFNAINKSKKNIQLDIVGIAASMGAVISQSRSDKKPRMVRNGFLMIHAPSGSTYGTALDHENTAKLLKSIEKNFIKMMVDQTGLSESKVSKWMLGDNWFDADEALSLGLISEIIEPQSETINNDLKPQELGVQGMYHQYTALLINPDTNSNINSNMKKPIIEALGLQGVNENSSDTAMIEAVKNHYESKIQAAENKAKEEKEKREALEGTIALQNKTAIAAEIENAKKQGKITAEQVPTYEGIAENSGLDTLRTVLASIPARKSITGQITGNVNNTTDPVGREGWDFDKWQKEDPRGFEALSKSNPDAFQEIVNKKYKK